MDRDKFHCQFSILIEELIIVILFIISTIIKALADGNSLDNVKYSSKKLAILLILAIIICIYKINVWRKTWIYIDGKSLVIEKNTMNKKVKTIALKNISNVNLEQNIIETILGTYKLKLDTNSRSTADETDVKIVLKKDKALQLKKAILQIAFDQETNENVIEEKNEDKYDIRYSLSQIIGHALYSASIVTIIYVIGLITVLIICYDYFLNELLKKGTFAIILSIFILIGCGIYKFFNDVLKYYNFKVGRRKNNIYISYGFLNKKEYVIPIENINGITCNSPVISRITNRKNIEIINIGMGDEKEEGAQLLLSEKDCEIREKLSRILPEIYLPKDNQIKKQNKKCFGLSALHFVIFSIIISILAIKFSYFFLVLLPLYIVGIILSYNTKGLYCGSEKIGISNGLLSRKVKYFSYDKIQNIKNNSSIISEKLNIEKMEFYVLASIINSVNESGYYDKKIIEEINGRIK